MKSENMPAATGPRYKVPFRRRREFLTNYRKRIALLKSNLPRLIVRKSNRSIIAHVAIVGKNGDETICFVHSNETKKYGWEPRANLPTSYLVGLLCGAKAKEKGIKKVVLDAGLLPSDVIFAAANGAKNFIEVNCKEINEERISGKHIADYYSSLSEEERIKKFGGYIKKNFDVSKIQDIFYKVKEKIINEYKNSG